MLHIVQCINATRCYSLSQREKKSDSEERMMENHMLEKKSLAYRRFFHFEIGWIILLMGMRWNERFFEFFVLRTAFEFFSGKLLLGRIQADLREFKVVQGSSRKIKRDQWKMKMDSKGSEIEYIHIANRRWWNSSDLRKSDFSFE